MTLVQAAFFFPGVVGGTAVLWLLARVALSIRHDRMNQVAGLEDLDELRWTGWNLLTGWPPVTCWHWCADFHRDDWWRPYLSRTCWPGCEHLHGDDWWKAYVDQADA